MGARVLLFRSRSREEMMRSRVDHSRLQRSRISSRDARGKMAAPSKNIAHSRILPATQASYFRYFTLRMCGALELVCGALEPRCGALKPRCGALKPGALKPQFEKPCASRSFSRFARALLYLAGPDNPPVLQDMKK